MPKHDHSTLKVLRSAGGYYVGMFCPKCGPWDRISHYFPTREECQSHLDWLNSLDEDDPDARL
jgi:hypothetical protein